MIVRLFRSAAPLSVLVFFTLAAACPAKAGDLYAFDKKQTSISFSVTRFGLFEMDGKFSDFDGNFIFCLRHPEKDAVAITLYSKGTEADDEDMNDELRGPDFFNAAKFPTIKFVGTSIKRLGADDAEIKGSLTLLGVTKPVTFDAHFTEKDHDAATGDHVVSFTASGVINRSDFGMDHFIPVIGDEVRLDIQVRGIKKDAD